VSALDKALADPWRLSVCFDGFTSIRTGTDNTHADADLIASVYEDEFAAMLFAAPQMLATLIACRDQFDFYATEHRKAGKHDKAATNEKFAFLATQAISIATGAA
jgi:hypothetical protein